MDKTRQYVIFFVNTEKFEQSGWPSDLTQMIFIIHQSKNRLFVDFFEGIISTIAFGIGTENL